MSDTDDTDVLLLIPPDFFLVNTDSDSTIDENWNEHCFRHCGVVKNLVGQVGEIKTRLNSIENSSSVYLDDSSTDMSRNFQFDEFRQQRYPPSSAKSTPQKPRNKLLANSLPSTPSTERDHRRYRRPTEHHRYDTKIIHPHKSHSTQSIQAYFDRDADDSSINTTPEKKENKEVLGEIDQFLTHVKTIKRYVTQKKLENSFNQPASLPISFENSPLKLSDLQGEGDTKERRRTLDLKDVDKLLQEMEIKQKKIEKNTSRIVEGNETQTQTWKPGESKNSVPDYDKGMRDIMYAKEDHRKLSNTLHDYINKRSAIPDSNMDLNTITSDSTNDTTPPTVFERNSAELLQRRAQQEVQNPSYNHREAQNQPYATREVQNQPYTTQNLHYMEQNQPYNPREVPPEASYMSAQSQKVYEYINQNPPINERNVEEEAMKKIVQSNVQFPQKNTKFNFDNANNNRNLFGLGDLWTYNKQEAFTNNEIRTNNVVSRLEEEKMRRQHCEKLIQDLQLKHLEMQQRLAVAVQVDCAKDAAILRFHEAWEKVADRWQSLETERNQLAHKLNNLKGRSDSDIAEATKKVLHYELEMSKALDLAHCSQEKCNNLEFEKNTLAVELDSVKNELDNLRISLNNIEQQRNELKEKINTVEQENIQDKKLMMDLQKEINVHKNKSQTDLASFQNELRMLREEKAKLEKEIKDSRGTCDVLESKNKNLENMVENCKKNEKALQHEVKKLMEQADSSKIELRNFYQQQVEILVKDKLKEFQAQLEQTEKSLHDELQNREQNIAKTAARQLQKLTEKHQLEVQLIEEKHREEIKLYDIQISQLKHLIATQQNKLDHMQMKRNNIAHELKSVMEAQWSEALRIINSGKTPASTPEAKGSVGLRDSNLDLKQLLMKDERYQAPEQEKGTQSNVALVSTPRTHNVPSDLQKYIKMLLDKEPGYPTQEDLRTIGLRDAPSSDCNDLSSYTKVSGPDFDETEKTVLRELRSKPPWK